MVLSNEQLTEKIEAILKENEERIKKTNVGPGKRHTQEQIRALLDDEQEFYNKLASLLNDVKDTLETPLRDIDEEWMVKLNSIRSASFTKILRWSKKIGQQKEKKVPKEDYSYNRSKAESEFVTLSETGDVEIYSKFGNVKIKDWMEKHRFAPQKWRLHHKLERFFTQESLQKFGMYKARPAIELIWMPASLHNTDGALSGTHPERTKWHQQELERDWNQFEKNFFYAMYKKLGNLCWQDIEGAVNKYCADTNALQLFGNDQAKFDDYKKKCVTILGYIWNILK